MKGAEINKQKGVIFSKQQAEAFDYSTLDFNKPDFYHLSEDIDLVLINGWLYTSTRLYAKDSKKFDNDLQAY